MKINKLEVLRRVKLILRLVTHNGFTKDDLVAALKDLFELYKKESETVILTKKEIKDLSLLVTEDDEDDTEVIVKKCPDEGILDESGEVFHGKYIAYLADYIDEGVIILGESKKNINSDKKDK